jgi:hypothetical protein
VRNGAKNPGSAEILLSTNAIVNDFTNSDSGCKINWKIYDGGASSLLSLTNPRLSTLDGGYTAPRALSIDNNWALTTTWANKSWFKASISSYAKKLIEKV